jgi:hypothetical protein
VVARPFLDPGRQKGDVMKLRRTIAVAAVAVAGVPTAMVFATGRASAVATASAAVDTCATYRPNVPDPAHFVDVIDNPYFPLPVGRTLVYRGGEGGTREIDRLYVTDKTKVIEGVTATVIHDVVSSEGHRQEITNDWYAQDDQGNVWYLGEDTRVLLANGHVDRSGSWMWGVDGAEPGLIMEANPRPPDAYRQECLTGEAEDMAWTVGRGGSVDVAYGPVHRVVRSFEFTRLEPNVISEKVYGPGLGIVLERDLHGGNETFELVKARG